MKFGVEFLQKRLGKEINKMKILFICGSLEPGRDGVGDYTRRLAAGLKIKKIAVLIIAINDTYITNISDTYQSIQNIKIPVIRISSSYNTKIRFKIIKYHISKYDPYWISLQFVGFGYNRYGIPLDLLLFIKLIIKQRKLHIMFHELWCGMSVDSGKKEKFLGILQKLFIRFMINIFKPNRISTSISTYEKHLFNLGANSNVLPIFSNIPKTNYQDYREIHSKYGSFNIPTLERNYKNMLVIGFFGSIYQSKNIKIVLNAAAEAAELLNLNLHLLSFGVNRGKSIIQIAEEIPGITYLDLGILTSSMIDSVMRFVNLGFITTPVDGINKSGTASAWLERGIPIIISPSDCKYVKFEMEPYGIFQIFNSFDILNALNNYDKILSVNRFDKTVNFYLNFLAKTNIDSLK